MSNESIRPSSLEGISRLATAIKREKGIKHLQAMDEAAQRAGFQNLRHAQNVLGGTKATKPPVFRVFLTAYWRDSEAATSGRETLTIDLSARWTDLLTTAELRSARGLDKFRPEGPDHLAARYVQRSQNVARGVVCHAARTLQFVAATRLRPSSGYTRAYPRGRAADKRVPGQDHVCVWFDSEKRYLIADEPYDGDAERNREERARWCLANGYNEAKSSWPGMHNPDDGTRLYLLSSKDNGVPLEPIIKALERLQSLYSEADWNGESAPRLPYFLSPGTISKGEAEAAARENAKQVPRKPSGPRKTVGYVWTMIGPRRRPDARMPIEAHAEVGHLLKSVLAVSHHRRGVYNRVAAIRDELDEWVQREYSRTELSAERFSNLYTGNAPRSIFPRALPIDERIRHTGSLAQVKTTLLAHYPDCAPLRAMLKRADAAIASLKTWAS